MKDRDFFENKKQILKKLEEAKKENLVDQGIIPILDIINKSDDYYTSSSCFGRITLLELPQIGDKKNAVFLGRWHRKTSKDEIFSALKNSSGKGQLWILAQSPIIHVYTKNLESANTLIKKAVCCGFKHSGFKSSEKNIIVEIASTERLDCPVGMNGSFYCDENFINLLVDISNQIFKKSVSKLKKLEKNLI
jgi:tRNA wybutosine-synthesizing protein 3